MQTRVQRYPVDTSITYRYTSGQRGYRKSDGCTGTLTGPMLSAQHKPCYNVVFDQGQVSRTGEWLSGPYPDLGQEAMVAEENWQLIEEGK